MDAIARALELMDPARRPAAPETVDGYLDLLGDESATGARPGQRLMENPALALVYERMWRPAWTRVLTGAIGPGMRDERRIAMGMLRPQPGERVLDVACGPGNFTRTFARAVGDEGLAVGLDASRAMLAQAAREAAAPNTAYLRADAARMPFVDGSFHAVCCFAALYLIEDPYGAIDEMVRVLAPGGRIALLASVNRGLLPTGMSNALVRGLTGVRVFGPEDLTGALEEHGLRDVRRRMAGFGQFVWARRP